MNWNPANIHDESKKLHAAFHSLPIILKRSSPYQATALHAADLVSCGEICVYMHWWNLGPFQVNYN